MEGGSLGMKAATGCGAILFGPFLMVIFFLASCGGGDTYQPCAFVAQPNPSATSSTPVMTDNQWALAERIIEREPDVEDNITQPDHWLAAVAITAALYGSNLLAPPTEGLPLGFNPFTGLLTTSMLDNIIDDFYERAMSTSDWRKTPPTQLAAWVIGQPGGDLAGYWPRASQITAEVTGASADQLIQTQLVDQLCEHAIGVDWDGTVTMINGWVFPVPVNNGISSNFGMRVNPVTGVYQLHTGTDIKANCMAPIVAAQDGVVIKRKDMVAGYGTLVEIVHNGGERTRYAHMFPGQISVNEGDVVIAGQPIALVGTNGNSTGCHLHFELINIDGNFVDPARTLGWN